MTEQHLFDQVTGTCLNDPSANYANSCNLVLLFLRIAKANASEFTKTAFKANNIGIPKI
jgi:hypothetical protein